jgi:hypothetical protein
MAYLVVGLLSALIAIVWLDYSLEKRIAEDDRSSGHQSLFAIIVTHVGSPFS